MSRNILVLLGPPGSGKGTQAVKIGRKLNLPVISTGNLLRQETDKKTAIGKKVEEKLNNGDFVSDDLINAMVKKRLLQSDVRGGFVLDGYPRNKEQLIFFISNLVKKRDDLKVLYIDVSDKEVKNRLGGRRVCAKCGRTYHINNKPPQKKGVCDKCGLELHKRSDDKPKVIQDRLEDFHSRTEPLVKYFDKNRYLIKINGDQDIPGVRKEIIKKLQQYGYC